MADRQDRLPTRAWYAIGVALALLGLYSWWPVFTVMNTYGHIPLRTDGPRVAETYGRSPVTFETQHAGTYSIFVPGWKNSRRAAQPECEVRTASGEPVALRSAARRNVVLDYDSYFMRWQASFTGEKNGRYNLVCNGLVDNDPFEVRREPGSRRVLIALELVALSAGLLAGGAIIGMTAVRRHRRRRETRVRPEPRPSFGDK